MDPYDVIVVGGGISGMSFAFSSANAGWRTLVIEGLPRIGGCLDSRRLASGYWFEMGAHTAYNSYGGFIGIIEACGLLGTLLPRAKAPFRLLSDGKIQSIAAKLNFFEMLVSIPRGLAAKKTELSVSEYYSRLVGAGNYSRALGPFLSAVPSQCADRFPSTMLFKRRPRRKDIRRSFTMNGGLGVVIDAIAKRPNLTVETGAGITTIEKSDGIYIVAAADGRTWEARAVTLACPAQEAAKIVSASYPELSRALQRVASATVDSVGVVVPRAGLRLDPVAGIIPAKDIFFSAVSRDTVPDDRYRAFTFHFRPGIPPAERLDRIAAVLGIRVSDPEAVFEKTTPLPSPVLGHDAIVREIDRLTAESRLRITGNYFSGLAIEDCASRSREEFGKLSRQQAAGSRQ